MANVTFTGNGTSGVGFAYITAATGSLITVSTPSLGAIDNYRGSFFYNGAGDLAGGTLNSFEETYFGRPVVTITNLSSPALPIANAVLSGDLFTALSLMLSGSDEIFGSAGGEAIAGFAGDDIMIALDGNDSVTGMDGNDDVNGNKGEDLVLGGAGADTVRGGQGNDTIFGDDGDDGHVNGNIGDDSVSGGNGNDTVYGGQGQDTLYGDAGADLLSGDLGNDVLFGGAGADRFTTRTGFGFDRVADFNFAEGDRIQLAPGTVYTVGTYQGSVMIDLGGGDQLALVGVAGGSFSTSWVVFG